MRAAGRIISAMGAIAVAATMGLMVATPASAHGAMNNPISRSYLCYQEGPEDPVTDVCQAVVAAGGPQPLYDWMEVNIANAAGNHRTLIPDGQLCSAGRDKYRGLDLARSDWPTTKLPSGGSSFTFEYRATAPHAGGYEFYVTKDGYDPNQPLRWSDLEDTPFHVEDSPQLVDGYYLMEATLPDKQGRHLIYAIWQRTDSPEAFYACSDVVFGEGGDNSAPPPPPAGDDGDDPDPGDDSGNDDGVCGPVDDDFSHAAHEVHDDTLAVAATDPDDSSEAGAAQPAIVGLAAAALGAALLLAKPGGTHRRKAAHRKP